MTLHDINVMWYEDILRILLGELLGTIYLWVNNGFCYEPLKKQ